MSDAPRHWVVIPAAGVGRRFGSTVPKQYLSLAGRTVLDHTLSLFVEHYAISGCVVALSADDGWWSDSDYAKHPRVRRAIGGTERSDSVLNGLKLLAEQATDDDWVLVHDAARPCLSRLDLDRLIESLADESVGALLAVPVHDTVKQSHASDPNRIATTVPRQRLWRAYTPQAFRLGLLRQALDQAKRCDTPITDDASAVELLGLNPRLVEGHPSNIKITRPEDLPLARFFLEQQGGSRSDGGRDPA